MPQLPSIQVVRRNFGCEPEALAPVAVLDPHWPAEAFRGLADEILCEFHGWYSGFTGRRDGRLFSLVSTHIGAPEIGQAVLGLLAGGVRRFVLAGPVGGLLPEMRIGDFFVSRSAFCGEGFSRYHAADHFLDDPFGWRVKADCGMTEAALALARERAAGSGVAVHEGRVFTTDSLLAETEDLLHFLTIKGAQAIDLVSSAVFNLAKVHQARAVGLYFISDLPLTDQCLFGDLSPDNEERRRTTAAALPALALDLAARFPEDA